jgi:hypothetical protein
MKYDTSRTSYALHTEAPDQMSTWRCRCFVLIVLRDRRRRPLSDSYLLAITVWLKFTWRRVWRRFRMLLLSWVAIPWRLVRRCRRFGETYCLYFYIVVSRGVEYIKSCKLYFLIIVTSSHRSLHVLFHRITCFSPTGPSSASLLYISH